MIVNPKSEIYLYRKKGIEKENRKKNPLKSKEKRDIKEKEKVQIWEENKSKKGKYNS